MAPSDASGGMAVITRYIITWNGTEGSSVTVGAGSTTHQVTGLTPDTTYSFTVSAENDCNMTSQGASATATTEGVCLRKSRQHQLYIPAKLGHVLSLLWCEKCLSVNNDSFNGSPYSQSFY